MDFGDFAKTGWITFLNSRESDGMFSKLSIVQTREDCTSTLLCSGCPAKVAANLYGLSQGPGGCIPTSAVVEHAENLSLLLGAMQVRMSLILQERVERKEVLPAAPAKPSSSENRPTTVTVNSESDGGSDWSSCSSDRRHQDELSIGSGSDWEMPGSQSSSGTASSFSETFLSSEDEDGISSAPSPTGLHRSAKRAKHSRAASSEQFSSISPDATKTTSMPGVSSD